MKDDLSREHIAEFYEDDEVTAVRRAVDFIESELVLF